MATTASTAPGSVADALGVLAAPAAGLGTADSLVDVLEAVAHAAGAATASDVAVVRVRDEEGFVARAVYAGSAAVAAELHGLHASPFEVRDAVATGLDALPAATRVVADRIGATAAIVLPVEVDGRVRGALELVREGGDYAADERDAARLASGLVAAAVRLLGDDADVAAREQLVELTGDALAAAAEPDLAAARVVRLVARATGADEAWLWLGDEEGLELVAAHGSSPPAAAATAVAVVGDRRSHVVEQRPDGAVATFRLGEPPVGALQARFAPERVPDDEALAAGARLAVRAAHALRAAERARRVSGELERSRALLDVLGEAISELSLSHTVATAAERVTALLGTRRVGIYLADGDRLLAVHGDDELGDGHDAIAERVLELALGPSRSRGVLVLPAMTEDAVLAGRLDDALASTGIEAAVAAPLVVAGDVIGLLAAYPDPAAMPPDSDVTLLAALGAQLAVALQNALLHERMTSLADEREAALEAERDKARQLEAQHRISESFTRSMKLAETLDAVVEAVVSALGVDAAAIHLPDERNAVLESRAVKVAGDRLRAVVTAILSRPQPLAGEPVRRMLRTARVLTLTAERATDLGGAFALLTPFLEKRSTALVLPIARGRNVLGTLTIVSLDAERPIDGSTRAAAMAIASQAAMAIDNARLYQHQQEFLDTMQRSLLPSSPPTIPGLELGAVYESAATVDVGGDVYDFLALPDGRLAVVLGDVTGHGVDATADMAMAKYVFRSLARLHPDPAALLAAANDVVVGDIAAGKFITMAALVADPARDLLTCACAGHPAPRLVGADGTVDAVGARGLALGIDPGQEYASVEVPFTAGSAVVLYTDGVIEARRGSELFGVERLDEVLHAERGRPADEVAQVVLEACREFAGGELGDDCAVVVVARR